MQQTHMKNTPGRTRRGGRNGTPQKTYASENDIPTCRQILSDSPSTPQKTISGVAHAQTTNQKQRSRNGNKSRNKAGTASPGFTNSHLDRQSPSIIAPAFAGATFHHSPAPSALPIPSFLARTTSAPDSPHVRPSAASPSQELSPPTTDSEEASEPSPPPRHDESPLEFMFKADRAEKARTRRASSANAGVPLGPFSPPHDASTDCNTFPRVNGPVQTRRPQVVRSPSSGISTNELDGNTGKPLGPSFSTPYQERIRASRSNSNSIKATPKATGPGAHSANFDTSSEALKRFLFSSKLGHQQQPQRQAQQQVPSPQTAQPKLPRGMFPASVLTGNPNAQQPQVQRHSPNGLRPDQMRTMEDSLRRVLKLDASS